MKFKLLIFAFGIMVVSLANANPPLPFMHCKPDSICVYVQPSPGTGIYWINHINSTIKTTYKHLPPNSWTQGTFWIYPFSAGQDDLKKFQVTSFSFKINYINAWVNNAQRNIQFKNCEFHTTNMTGGISYQVN